MSLNQKEPQEKKETRNSNGPESEGIKIDGLQQVIELLKYADPVFRESLLKRLSHRDPALVKSLRKIIR